MKTERIAVPANHKNEREFFFDVGVPSAASTMADRVQFVLDETQWQALQDALDRPVQAKARLEKLVCEPGVLG